MIMKSRHQRPGMAAALASLVYLSSISEAFDCLIDSVDG